MNITLGSVNNAHEMKFLILLDMCFTYFKKGFG